MNSKNNGCIIYKKKEERDHIKDQRYVGLLDVKKEALKLKKRQLDLKETELEQRKEIATKKAKKEKKSSYGTDRNRTIKIQIVKETYKRQKSECPQNFRFRLKSISETTLSFYLSCIFFS